MEKNYGTMVESTYSKMDYEDSNLNSVINSCATIGKLILLLCQLSFL